ncbi:hypothetical protein D918_08523 [Trichuris suis]|nr:hypothetical protein D918_08523 [Trichuris suis]
MHENIACEAEMIEADELVGSFAFKRFQSNFLAAVVDNTAQTKRSNVSIRRMHCSYYSVICCHPVNTVQPGDHMLLLPLCFPNQVGAAVTECFATTRFFVSCRD